MNFHIICEYDLPNNSFTVNNEIYNVPCVFQIWIKKNINRSISIKYNPINYKFVKKEETPDISFRRVGVYAGKIDKNIDKQSIQSHYFIKFDFQLTDSLFEKILNINYKNKDNTVGPKSISKQELMKELNEIINQNIVK